jgi:phage/plasmid-like protein (TIGR03299 family)
MTHEIDTSRGKAAVFTVRQPAWHGLGKVIQEAATSEEAIELAELDWEVEQWPVFAQDQSPMRVKASGIGWLHCQDRVANVRTDTNRVLGVVGRNYRVFQNREAFDFMDEIVGEKLAMYETAGALKGGRRVWMLAKVPKEYRIGDDVVESYTLLTNNHDGCGSLRMLPTTVRVVCANTLNLALGRAAGGISICHWPKLTERVREAREALGIIGERLDQFGEQMQVLAARKLNTEETEHYFGELFPQRVKPKVEVEEGRSVLEAIIEAQEEGEAVVKDLLAGHFARTEREAKRNRRIFEQVLANYENPGNSTPEIKHSAWTAYNAVSEWVDHERTSRGKTEVERADNRLQSVWFGSGDAIKQQAFASALELTTGN